MNNLKKLTCALGFCLMLPAASQASVITFNFTGGVVVTAPGPSGPATIIPNGTSPVTNISATLTYDTVSGLGNSDLSLTMSGGFWSEPATFHDISMSLQPGGNLISGTILVDWSGVYNQAMHIEWDVTGLNNAIAFGLQAGDIISGTNLYRDINGNGVGDAGEWLADVNSATPYSDILQDTQGYTSLQGPAPMAATSGSMGFNYGSPFYGIQGYFDIGSGNSMHVVSVSSVSVPAAMWLLGSGLLGLIGMSRRNTV